MDGLVELFELVDGVVERGGEIGEVVCGWVGLAKEGVVVRGEAIEEVVVGYVGAVPDVMGMFEREIEPDGKAKVERVGLVELETEVLVRNVEVIGEAVGARIVLEETLLEAWPVGCAVEVGATDKDELRGFNGVDWVTIIEKSCAVERVEFENNPVLLL